MTPYMYINKTYSSFVNRNSDLNRFTDINFIENYPVVFESKKEKKERNEN
jgi:hypothetical protein